MLRKQLCYVEASITEGLFDKWDEDTWAAWRQVEQELTQVAAV